jgi:hypothetical protein
MMMQKADACWRARSRAGSPGPLFLTDRMARVQLAGADLDSATGAPG